MDFSSIKKQINLDELSAAEIFERENFEAIKYAAYNYIDSLDWDNAIQFSIKLERKLAGVSPGSREGVNFYNILVFWILRLRLFAFRSLPIQDRFDLMHNNTVKMLASGLDVKGYVSKALDFYGSQEALQKEIDGVVNALNTSAERLGANVRDPNFKPTLANWIKEYRATLFAGGTTRPEAGGFHIVKFIDSNPYVKTLDKKEVEILRQALDLLNLLTDPITYVLPEGHEKNQVKTAQGLPYMAAASGNMKSALPDNRPRPLPPAVPKKVAPPAPAAVKPSSPVPPVQPKNTESISDLKLKIEENKKRVQDEIDRKLAELRRKVQK